MPALDCRLNIAIKSGTAANVVPKPATIPTISDRLNSENRMLCGSAGVRSLHAHRETVLQRMPQKTIRLDRCIRSTFAKTVPDTSHPIQSVQLSKLPERCWSNYWRDIAAACVGKCGHGKSHIPRFRAYTETSNQLFSPRAVSRAMRIIDTISRTTVIKIKALRTKFPVAHSVATRS